MVSAVFFDLYETLITECNTSRSPVPALATRLGIDEARLRAEWDVRREKSMTGTIPDYPSLLREICRSVGNPVEEALLEQLRQERVALKVAPFRQIEDDVLRGLEHIRDSGIQIGLISNVRPEEAAGWATCRLAPLTDDAIFSCEVGTLKPDPHIYLLACSRLDVTPERCIFVGDGGSDELRGAAAVGMTPYWATWFLERWPFWDQGRLDPQKSGGFPRLAALDDLIRVASGS